MWIDKVNQKKISKPYLLPNMPMQAWNDEATLNSLGIFTASVTPPTADRRYYDIEEVVDYTTATVRYTETPKAVGDVQARMLRDLSTVFAAKKSERPVVDTGLGFSVDGGREDIDNMEIGQKHGLPQVRGADDLWYAVSTADYDTIISAIELNGIKLFQTKWSKEATVSAFTTLDECIAYENQVRLVDVVNPDDPATTITIEEVYSLIDEGW